MATGRASAWSSTINTLNKFCSTHLDHNRLQSFELFQGNNKLRTKVSNPKSHLLIVDDKGKKKKEKKKSLPEISSLIPLIMKQYQFCPVKHENSYLHIHNSASPLGEHNKMTVS